MILDLYAPYAEHKARVARGDYTAADHIRDCRNALMTDAGQRVLMHLLCEMAVLDPIDSKDPVEFATLEARRFVVLTLLRNAMTRVEDADPVTRQ